MAAVPAMNKLEESGARPIISKFNKSHFLIIGAVVQELDGCKRTENGSRSAIRWLEREFREGRISCLNLFFIKGCGGGRVDS